MIIDFFDLHKYDFSLSNIKIYKQTPVYRSLKVKNRAYNGFIYLQEGNCTYSFEGGEFSFSDGSLIYLPLNSTHYLECNSEKLIFYRIDFTLKINNEIALFSNKPIKITDDVSTECVEAIIQLAREVLIEENTILKTENLCRIFGTLQKKETDLNHKKISPAVKYICEHFTEEIDCTKLSKLCFLGTSRFYELFRKEFGITPLEYRNKILIKQAKFLLVSSDISVKEIAFNLGFQSVAYFSRFFKKHTGFSPNEYKKDIELQN